MREVDFLDAVGRVDARHIEECVTYRPNRTKRWIALCASAAAVLIAVVVALGVPRGPAIIDRDGFYIEDGVLLSYSGSETDVTIPDEVEVIADYAFLSNKNSGSIEVVRLGGLVEKVESNAFAGLSSLSDLVVDESSRTIVDCDGVIMSADGSVIFHYERTGETEYSLPETVKYIAAHAFQNCGLETIHFNNGLQTVGYNAFAGCGELKAIYLPESVTYIDEGAFASCVSAVDGYVPSGALVESGAFGCVPFHLSLQAGQMSPLEMVKRDLITPSEAILQSNLQSLQVQIEYVLAVAGGRDYEPTDAAMFAYGAVSQLPLTPEDMTVPETFSFEELTFADRGWGNTGPYDVQIILPAGNYTIVMEAYGYETYEALYWSDVRFRITNIYYLRMEQAEKPTEATYGWTAVMEQEGDLYTGITLVHESGEIIRCQFIGESNTPYVCHFSPNGTRCAIEYDRGGPGFYVQALNHDKLLLEYGDNNSEYNIYLNRYYGQYEAGTLKWIDNDNLEGINEFGRFRFNIYRYEVTYLEDDQQEDDPVLYEPESVVTVYPESHSGWDFSMEIPASWQDRGAYYDKKRQAQGLEDYRALLPSGIPLGLVFDENGSLMLDRAMEKGWFTSVVDIVTGINQNGHDYVVLREIIGATTGVSIDQKEGQYYVVFLAPDRMAVLDFCVVVYRDDPDDYVTTVLQAIIDSVTITQTGSQ